MREDIMKKEDDKVVKEDIRSEYDFAAMTGGIQGKYAQRHKEGTNLVHLEPDIAAIFKDEASVNKALRSLIDVARRQVPVAR